MFQMSLTSHLVVVRWPVLSLRTLVTYLDWRNHKTFSFRYGSVTDIPRIVCHVSHVEPKEGCQHLSCVSLSLAAIAVVSAICVLGAVQS